LFKPPPPAETNNTSETVAIAITPPKTSQLQAISRTTLVFFSLSAHRKHIAVRRLHTLLGA